MPEYRFNPAPGWPETESDWVPPKGWRPDPTWPHAPQGWQFWTEIRDPYQPPDDHIPSNRSPAVEEWQAPPATSAAVPHVGVSPRVESFNGMPVLYTRQQQGRSAVLYSLGTFIAFLIGVLVPLLFGQLNFLSLIFFGLFLLFLGQAIYFTKSPNYYWRL